MLTVGEWFDILRHTKNMVFGLQMEYGLPCNRYLIAQEFEKYYKDWFGEKCIRVYPTLKTLGGIMYCVFVYKNKQKQLLTNRRYGAIIKPSNEGAEYYE